LNFANAIGPMAKIFIFCAGYEFEERFGVYLREVGELIAQPQKKLATI